MRRRVNRLMDGGRTFIQDSFTDTNGVLTEQHANESGTPWIHIGSNYGASFVSSNRFVSGELVGGFVNGSIMSTNRLRRRNGRMSCDIVRIATINGIQIGLMFRCRQAGNPSGLMEAIYSGGVPGWRFVHNNATVVGSTVTASLTQDQVYRLEVQWRGGRIRLLVDGVSTVDVDAARGSRGGRVGIFVQNIAAAPPSTVVIDNWRVER